MNGIKELDLSFNSIVFLNDKQFSSCNKLQKLILKANKIKFISNGSLFGLDALEYLNLESNLIKGIEINSFNYLLRLKSLHLKSNKLERIENLLESVSPKILNDLKSIDLSNNFIENFDLINLKIQFENINVINLNQNNINNFTNIFLENIIILK